MADNKKSHKGGPPSPSPTSSSKVNKNIAVSIKPPGAKKEGEKVKEVIQEIITSENIIIQ